jgi:lycopene beta-cyclase
LKLYDYIFAGAGAAGLMTVLRMCRDPYFADKSILLIDQDSKSTNDRTWCFWEHAGGEWDHILTKKWDHIKVGSDGYGGNLDLGEFQYKMISGLDFYTYVKNELKQNPNVQFVEDVVSKIDDKFPAVHIEGAKRNYMAKHVFNSIFKPNELAPKPEYPYLNQHFIGWFIETEKPVFDDNTATFMDFDLPQKGNTRFMYVLPFSSTRALVEYTLFSKDLLPDHEYEEAIQDYCLEKQYGTYKIYGTEKGIVPMTTYPFDHQNTKHITHIGTAGGWSKACTGYTFMNTARYSTELVHNIKSHGKHSVNLHNKWWYYDHVMLRVLSRNNQLGAQFFTSIFQKADLNSILRFLDSKSSLNEDLSIILSSKPKSSFTKEFFLSIPTFVKTFFS